MFKVCVCVCVLFTSTFIPDVVITPLGPHVMEDDCIAAPETCMNKIRKQKKFGHITIE